MILSELWRMRERMGPPAAASPGMPAHLALPGACDAPAALPKVEPVHGDAAL